MSNQVTISFSYRGGKGGFALQVADSLTFFQTQGCEFPPSIVKLLRLWRRIEKKKGNHATDCRAHPITELSTFTPGLIPYLSQLLVFSPLENRTGFMRHRFAR